MENLKKEMENLTKNKIKFNDLELDTKKIYFDKIEHLNNKMYEFIQDDYMMQQSEELENLNIKKYVDIKDHYTSFYLICRDHIKFIENIEKDYLNDDNIKLYEEIKNIYNEYINVDLVEEEEKANEIYNKLENKVNELVDGITEQLKKYENITNEDINDYINYNDEFINCMFDNLYIDQDELKNNIYIVYDISISYNCYI